MYQIARICVANYGHGEARFKSNLADFRRRKDGRVAKSVMMYAPNGKGKTTFLSFMLHLFQPSKTRFVQRLQKPNHHFYHYFREGQPGLIVMELTRRSESLEKAQRDMVASDIPALIIGAVVNRKGDAVDERFFLIDPSVNQYRLEHIPFLESIIDGKRTNITNEQVEDWLKAGRTSIKGFSVHATQQEWAGALTAKGFNLHAFDVMVTMASKEGGIEKFLESTDPDEILGKVFSLFIDEDLHRPTVDELSAFINDNLKLPVEKKNLEIVEKLISMEEAFVEVAAARSECLRANLAVRSVAKSAAVYALEQRETLDNESARLGVAIDESKAVLTHAKSRLDQLEVEREAYRIAKSKRNLAASVAKLTERKAEIATTELSASVYKAAPFYKRKLSSEATLEHKRVAVSQLRHENLELLAPLNEAGARLYSVLEREISGARIAMDQARDEALELAGQVNAAGQKRSGLAAELHLRKQKIDDVVEARNQIQKLLAKATEILGNERPIETIDQAREMKATLEASLETVKQSLMRISGEKADVSGRLNAAEKEIESAKKHFLKVQSEIKKAETLLHAFEASEAAFIEGHLDYLKSGEDWSIDDPRLVEELRKDDAEFRQRIGVIEDRITDLKAKLQYVSGIGMFEDTDTAEALRLCQAAGVKDISTFSNWISKNIPDVSVARDLVESNLHMSLGLRVLHEADLDKIKRVFNRETWKLRKPVSVTVVGPDERQSVRGDSQIVLSAENDYAYHENTRQKREDDLRKRIEDSVKELDSCRAYHGRIVSALNALQDHKSRFESKTGVHVREDLSEKTAQFNDARSRIEVADGDLERLVKDFEEIKLAAKSASAEDEKLKGLKCDFDGVFEEIGLYQRQSAVDIDLHASERAIKNLDTEIAEIGTSIEGLNGQIDEINRKIGAIAGHAESMAREKDTIQFRDVDIQGGHAGISIEMARREYDTQRDLYNRKADGNHRIAKLEEEIITLEQKIVDENKLVKDAAAKHYGDSEFFLRIDEAASLSDAEIEATGNSVERRREELVAICEGLIRETSKLEKDVELSEGFAPRGEAVSKVNVDTDISATELDQLIAEVTESVHQQNVIICAANASVEQDGTRRVAVMEDARKVTEWHSRLEKLADDAPEGEPFVPEADIDWDGFCKALEKDVGVTGRKLNTAKTASLDHHRKIVDFIIDKKNELTTPDFRERVTGFKSDVDHGANAPRLLEILRRKAEQHQTVIVLTGETLDNVVISVTNLAEKAVQKILRAATIKVPETGSRFSSLPIIKLPSGIDRQNLATVQLKDIVMALVNRKLAEYADLEAGRIRTVHAIDTASELCVQIMKLIAQQFGKDAFILRILKPVDQASAPVWENINALTGSGGQTITSALLLNLVATALHGNDINSSTAQAFIILDNPIGKANLTDLVGIQLMMAETFGIQMIATSGINDYYLSCYDWIVSFDVTTKAGDILETRVHYEDNDIALNNHSLKVPDLAT